MPARSWRLGGAPVGRAIAAARDRASAALAPLAGFPAIEAVALGPRSMSLLPALCLAAHAAWGPGALIGLAALAPLLVALALRAEAWRGERAERDGLTGLVMRGGVAARLDRALAGGAGGGATLGAGPGAGLGAGLGSALGPGRGRGTACLVVEIDDFRRTADRLGMAQADEVLRRVGERLRLTCRSGDAVGRLGGASFAVALDPTGRADPETVLHLAERLQAAVAEPVATADGTARLTASVGFCLPSRAPRSGGAALMEAAERAAAEARRAGPSAVRAYSEEIGQRMGAQDALARRAEVALREGWIVPWFQPQLCTETGRISGFEALARWCDPERGVLAPGDFLPALERAGLLERLGEAMLRGSLRALRAWDRAGVGVPSVSVNFSPEELRDPALLDRVRWEIDGFELEPRRLTVEVLETVVAGQGDEAILGNLRGLAGLGCRIDLDDFGTGHASIGAVRRFPIARLKIDRSFVAGIEEDPEQHRMVSAILGLAERLGLETVAEGVETPGQHALLAQLGCGHVQGFGIARPMPFDEATVWVERLAGRVEAPPPIARRAG